MPSPLLVLELYCGIGGCATALRKTTAEVTAAIDINPLALRVYRHNFSHPTLQKLFDPMDPAPLAADLWWASPPCQPFTRRGKRSDLEDPRARTFLALLQKIEAVRPFTVALENVVGFEASDARGRFLEVLERSGYVDVREHLLCPSELGVPNRRPRYYAVASRGPLLPETPLFPETSTTLGELLEPGERERADRDPALRIDPEILKRYDGALHLVDGDDPEAVTYCFTSAYGRSHVRSGSLLRLRDGARRFSPLEILRLLGFPRDFALPSDLPLKNAWRLVGNTLSLEPVRRVLSVIPGLREVDDPDRRPAPAEPPSFPSDPGYRRADSPRRA